VEADLPKYAERVCAKHGRTEFVLEGRGYYRCKRCRMQRVLDWRRRTKEKLIAECRCCCQICGHDRYGGALHFHHLDPAEKEFGIARKGFTRSIDKARAETAKCVLLCSNCHAEVEAGIVTLLPTQADAGVRQMDIPG
jgi:5-methylcytosine-specific restriction endonuclease McrA